MITTLTYLFFIYLLLALFVERAVEITVSVLNYADYKLGWYRYWNGKAEKYRVRLDKLYGYQGDDSSATDKLFGWINWNVVAEKPYPGGRDIISAESIRVKYIRISSRIFAFILSLGFAWFMYNSYKADLITLFEAVSDTRIIPDQPYLKVLLTAVLLSAGSEPLHQVIVRAETIGKRKAKQNEEK